MLKRIQMATLVIVLSASTVFAQSKVTQCPGYNPINNTNLACEFATAIRSGGTLNSGLSTIPAAFAAQLSNLPVATAVSGTGIIFVNGIPSFSSESLGTILTERGDTLGKHRFFFSFNYQRFGFGSVDGIKFKGFSTVSQTNFPGIGTTYQVNHDTINLVIDQFTALATYGLTNRMDLTLIVPFSTVNLRTTSNGNTYNADANGNPIGTPGTISAVDLGGSKTGPGDITLSLKANIFTSQSEKTAIAVGTELRLPTGDETNYLGTGAYGVKPYFILSHRGKRFTPNVNLGYEWNGTSSLYFDPNTGNHLNLPGSFLYTGGVDYKVTSRLTLVGEFLGQYVINGPRVVASNVNVPGAGTFLAASASNSAGNALISSYADDNIGGGFKVNPFRGLLLSASVMFKLDDSGLRAKVVPLVGASYRF